MDSSVPCQHMVSFNVLLVLKVQCLHFLKEASLTDCSIFSPHQMSLNSGGARCLCVLSNVNSYSFSSFQGFYFYMHSRTGSKTAQRNSYSVLLKTVSPIKKK